MTTDGEPEVLSHAELVTEVKRLRRDLKWVNEQVEFNDRQEGKLERYFDKVVERATENHEKLGIAHAEIAVRDHRVEHLAADLEHAQVTLRERDVQIEVQAATLRHYHNVIELIGADIERRRKRPDRSYAEFPDHPLCGVPERVLDAARAAVREAAAAGDVDPEQVEPIADAVVVAVLAACGESPGVMMRGDSIDAWLKRHREGYRAADGALLDRIAQAINDPASIVGRRLGPSRGEGNDGYAEKLETVTRWSVRAVMAVLAGVGNPAAG